ncbi:MAG: amidohydrolase family protein, partial [Acidobacteriota bacterium]|nr:amidohydrolase family protein [Acidobacteriota bacterium]
MAFTSRLLPAAGLLAVLACAPPAEVQHVDLILHSGVVLTLDEQDSRATALAVKDERIVAVGGNELLERFSASQTVDLGGRTLMPGFIDSHIHINGRPPHFIELSSATSVAEIRDLVSS